MSMPHPHMSNDEKIAIVHNGIIENYAQCGKSFRPRASSLKSDTDTEVVAHLMDLYYEGDLKKAVLKTISRLEGAYALGILCAEEKGRIIAARHAAPLIVGVGIGEKLLCLRCHCLGGLHQKTSSIWRMGRLQTSPPKVSPSTTAWGKPTRKPSPASPGTSPRRKRVGMTTSCSKEIMERPNAIKSTIEPRIKDGEVVLDDFSLTDEELKNINKIMITACGSAYYAGAWASMSSRTCAGFRWRQTWPRVALPQPLVDEHTLLVVVSQSGETADTLAAMKECKARGPGAGHRQRGGQHHCQTGGRRDLHLGRARDRRSHHQRHTPPSWRCWICWRCIWPAAWAGWMTSGTGHW